MPSHEKVQILQEAVLGRLAPRVVLVLPYPDRRAVGLALGRRQHRRSIGFALARRLDCKGEARRCDDPVLELRESAVADTDVQIEVLPSSFQGIVVPTALGTVAKPTAMAAPSDATAVAAPPDEQEWLQRGAAAARGFFTKVKSNGKAGALSLVAETVVFWVAILIPASEQNF